MIPRHRVPLFLQVVLVLSMTGVACQRVPLLAPSGSTITLTAAATFLPLNGTTDLIVQIIEASGTPPQSGTHVIFTTTLGTIQPSETETDINGRATVKFLAGTTSGTASITASSGNARPASATSTTTAGGGTTSASDGAIKIAIGSAAVSRVSVSANPGTVAASGGSSTITANAADANGNSLPGVPVTFTTDAGSFSAAVVTTDQNGNAQTTLTTNKTARVTATAGPPGTAGTGTTTGGATSSPQTATVTVNVNATSTITVGAGSPAAPVVGQAVTFAITYTQNANGSPVARVIVDFGDGSNAQTIQGQPSAVSHTYNQAGSFTVRATAFDSFGDTAAGTGNVTVAAKPQLAVTISSPTASPTPNAATTVSIVATPSTGNVITSVRVDFGDGTAASLSGNAASVQHVYTTAGTFTVIATATDSSGATGSASTIIVVGNRPQLVVTIKASATPAVNTPTTFDLTATAGTGATISSIVVDFGDGSRVTLTGNATSVQHTYTAPGTFTVTATAADTSGATGSASTVIVVSGGASFTISPASAASHPATIAFDASSSTLPSPITNYAWDFGDPLSGPNNTASGSAFQQTHRYDAAGTYTVTLTVSDSAGRTSRIVKTVTIG